MTVYKQINILTHEQNSTNYGSLEQSTTYKVTWVLKILVIKSDLQHMNTGIPYSTTSIPFK